MTGYGVGTVTRDNCQAVVELRSVNGRFLELSSRLPRFLQKHETVIQSLLSKYVHRGTVEISINFLGENSIKKISMDWGVANQYRHIAKIARTQFLCDDDFNVSALLRSPEVLQVSYDDELVFSLLLDSLELACIDLDKMRATEGKFLQSSLKLLLDEFCVQLDYCANRAIVVQQQTLEKLQVKLSQLIEQEQSNQAAILDISQQLDKLDINEELTRLVSHTEQFRETLDSNSQVGKKLDFVLQEMNREINTIGSKSRDVDLTHIVVECKLILEKLKEQSRNVE